MQEDDRFKESMVTKIFGGTLRSVVRKKGVGLKASASIEPFFSIPLDIKSEQVNSVSDALNLYMAAEKLSDYTDNDVNVEASKQCSIETLPKVLTLHLKRFDYTLYGIEKIPKPVSFPLVLNMRPNWLANEKQHTPEQKTYKLFAVVSHWGRSGIGGHYTVDIVQPNLDWLQFDDASITKVSQETVLSRAAYLLMYIQS